MHHIAIHVPWLWQMGKAQITVDNSTGQAPPVYYALPYTGFHKGAIGHQPVANPGLAAFLLMIGVPVAVILVCCVAGALFSD